MLERGQRNFHRCSLFDCSCGTQGRTERNGGGRHVAWLTLEALRSVTGIDVNYAT